MLTLWDVLDPQVKPGPARPAARRRGGRADAAVERYVRMEREMLARHQVRVRKWRSNTTGVAWQVEYHDGAVTRLIESPRPRGPVSAAVFLHEIGHHAIGFDRYKVRCVEEYHAWRFSLEQMEAHGIAITPRVRKRVIDCLEYAIAKAQRRGIRRTPADVLACIDEQKRLLVDGAPLVGAGTPRGGRPRYASTPNNASMNAPGSNG